MMLDELINLIIQRLVAARERAGMTQQDVADAMSVHQSVVSRWESQTYSLDLVLFIRLCALYRASPALILAGESQSPEARIAELESALKEIDERARKAFGASHGDISLLDYEQEKHHELGK